MSPQWNIPGNQRLTSDQSQVLFRPAAIFSTFTRNLAFDQSDGTLVFNTFVPMARFRKDQHQLEVRTGNVNVSRSAFCGLGYDGICCFISPRRHQSDKPAVVLQRICTPLHHRSLGI